MAASADVGTSAARSGCGDGDTDAVSGSGGAGERGSEVYVTAAEGAVVAGRSMEDGADEYVTARRRRLEQLRSECGSEEEYEAMKSREHWTEVGGPCTDADRLFISNREYFERLVEQDNTHSGSGFHRAFLGLKSSFFVEYGDDELVVGEKIGEGGQAEIFRAAIRGKDKFVVKVFKPGCDLAQLERQWTIRNAYGSYHAPSYVLYRGHCCYVENGTLLRDGRLAFVMRRYWGDLRKVIDQKMQENNGLGPPFSSKQALHMMRSIAEGMWQLHRRGIWHRDLKASNVLVAYDVGFGFYEYAISDFEFSTGVLGTKFWRAPEILQALKEKVRGQDLCAEIWTEKVDVYSFAMTCYEIMTGRIPFGDLVGTRDDYDAVIRGERPLLPDYVGRGIRELITRCWDSDPLKRPTFSALWEQLARL